MSRNRVVYRKAISMIGLMANRIAMEMKALRETMPKSHRNVLPPRKPSSQPLPRAMMICPSASGMMPDDHVLPALRPDDEPCIQHGGKEEEQKQRKVGLEHDAGEQGYQQAHHAIAPGREDERAQPRGTRHGEEVDDEGDVLRLDDLAHEHVGAFRRDAEDEQQQRDEQKVLFPQGVPGLPLGAMNRPSVRMSEKTNVPATVREWISPSCFW